MTPDPELEVHRLVGEFRLGARSFGITDSLTLLYSHRHFHETARLEAQRAALQDRPFAVIVAQFVEIDELNHRRGFAAGDETIQAVGAAFHRAAARCQGQAFRASGRRIALLGPDLDQAAADRAVNALRLETRDALGDERIALAIGASVWRTGEDGEQIIQRAVIAADEAQHATTPRS